MFLLGDMRLAVRRSQLQRRELLRHPRHGAAQLGGPVRVELQFVAWPRDGHVERGPVGG